jgi:hypothetical protein
MRAIVKLDPINLPRISLELAQVFTSLVYLELMDSAKVGE